MKGVQSEVHVPINSHLGRRLVTDDNDGISPHDSASQVCSGDSDSEVIGGERISRGKARSISSLLGRGKKTSSRVSMVSHAKTSVSSMSAKERRRELEVEYTLRQAQEEKLANIERVKEKQRLMKKKRVLEEAERKDGGEEEKIGRGGGGTAVGK